MTASEDFISQLCRQSFLPFWSHVSPIGKKGKELCDVLIVCGNFVIIVSVKDIRVTDHEDELIQYERWVKKAIHESVDQIYGAERFLGTVNEVELFEGGVKITLPPAKSRVTFRVAIAFGSKENFPLPIGDFEKGFVHVFDEKSSNIIFRELDTISDFTEYLRAKEAFFVDKIVLIPSEADLLAIYLKTGFKFDDAVNTFVCDDGVWEDYQQSKDYQHWQDQVKDSFIWDQLINDLYRNNVNEYLTQKRAAELEEAVRYINLEPRLNRIELGLVLKNAISSKVKARMIKPLPGSNHAYVFIPLNKKNWEAKESELKLRCIIARVENPQTQNIIGISIGKDPEGKFIFDICFFHLAEIDENFIVHARAVQKDLGYFNKPVISHSKNFR